MALVTKKVLLMLHPESTPPGRLIMHSKDLDYIKTGCLPELQSTFIIVSSKECLEPLLW